MVLNQPEADPEVSLDNPAGRSGLAVGWWRTVQNEHCQHNLSREHGFLLQINASNRNAFRLRPYGPELSSTQKL